MDDFMLNFLANLLADTFLGIIIFVAIRRPGEKKKAKENLKKALGLLRTEIEINVERTSKYISKLNKPVMDISELIPMRYSRGAWNALKESNFLPEIDNPDLVYFLLRMNETALVANKNLRKFELCFLEESKGNKEKLAEVAMKESVHLNKIFIKVASILEQMDIPSFEVDEIFLSEVIVDEDEQQ